MGTERLKKTEFVTLSSKLLNSTMNEFINLSQKVPLSSVCVPCMTFAAVMSAWTCCVQRLVNFTVPYKVVERNLIAFTEINSSFFLTSFDDCLFIRKRKLAPVKRILMIVYVLKWESKCLKRFFFDD